MERGPIVAWLENSLHQRLAALGLDVRYTRRSWTPAKGLRLEQLTIRRIDRGDRPLAEVSALEVGFSPLEWCKTGALITHWSLKDATATIHDDHGAITFKHVSARILARAGRIETPEVDFQQGPRIFALRGQVLFPERAQNPPPPILIDFGFLRSVFGVLEFKEGHPPFVVQGNCLLDYRTGFTWRADLNGTGQDVEWQGVPLRKAATQGHFTPAGMDLNAHLQLTTGSADFSVKRSDWAASPILIAGTFTDGVRQSDDFSAAYYDSAHRLTISALHGKAQLLEFARNFPKHIPHVPSSIQFEKFPDLTVSDFTCSFPDMSGPWSVGAIQTRSTADLTLQTGGDPIRLADLEGRLSQQGGQWKARLKSGPIHWKHLNVPGASVDGALTGARLQAKLDLQLNKGSVAVDLASADCLRAPVRFTGAIADGQGLRDRVSGSYQYDPEELQLVHLEGKANLFEFAGNFPGVAQQLPKVFQFRAFPDIAISDFAFRPNRPPTLGALRLVEPADLTIEARGRPVTLEHVEGQAAFDGNAWKFTQMRGRLFGGQWSMDGVFRDAVLREAKISASGLHLAEAKAWMGESPSEIGAAVLALEYRGNIGAEPAQFTGDGVIRLENAPIVKVPILDQTYTLASALTSPLSHRGSGRLEATFAAREGIAKVSKFVATSESVKVTAEGTVDFRRGQASGRAQGDLRGLFGLVTSPISRTLEMEVSGPLDNIRVRSLGFNKGLVNASKKFIPDTAKGAARLIQNSAAFPLRVFDIFKPAPIAKKPAKPE